MCNLVFKAFEQVRTGTTPTPYLTLVIDKTGTFIATCIETKSRTKSTNCCDEFLTRPILTVKHLPALCSDWFVSGWLAWSVIIC